MRWEQQSDNLGECVMMRIIRGSATLGKPSSVKGQRGHPLPVV